MRWGGCAVMRVLAGLWIQGSVVRPRLSPGMTSLGAPAWGPANLLRDLELRLGLPPVVESESVRLPRYTSRIKTLNDKGAFYARSFAVDELGTASTLLEWRDALVEAGWNGSSVRGGGERLDALARLESHERAGMPLGRADRLLRVEQALEAAPARPYSSITLVEEGSLWPRRWQHVFRRLEALGASISTLSLELPGASATSDLGILQAQFRGDGHAGDVRGDGSLLLLRGDTLADLGELTASLLADSGDPGSDVVVRSADAWSLETALARHGLPAQGLSGESVWRPSMQVLPLALELAFEPRDPHRALELLTLALGPFRGVLGSRLARAVARQPGIGGKEWRRQKDEAERRLRERHLRLAREQGKSKDEVTRIVSELVEARLERVATWFEAPSAGPSGATRAELLAVIDRVRDWLKGCIARGEAEVYGTAYAQAAALREAILLDTRDVFTQEEARQLVDRFARSEQAYDLSVEAVGRIAHLAHPAGLLAPCRRVTFWGFVASAPRRPPSSPWNEEERAALSAAGVSLPDPAALLRAEAQVWRRAILAARERAVFVVPNTIKGVFTSPHPMWDEICARLRLDERDAARMTREARRILERRGEGIARVATIAPLRLPESRGAWRVPPGVFGVLAGERETTVTSLEKIATCPLAWVLEQPANLRSGAMAEVASGPLLSGSLGHRLVEELHAEGAFELAEDAFCERAQILFEALLRTEGATLLLPGASIERLQLTRQILRAMRNLYRYLQVASFRIASVEEIIETRSAIGVLRGRLDLRLVDREGRPAILDLKWGASTYRRLLAEGHAVQLAVYARAVEETTGHADTPAAYFALSTGQVLSADARMTPPRVDAHTAPHRTIEGPSLGETWRLVESTAEAVLDRLERGEIPVSGAKRSLPLLDALGVPERERAAYFEAPPDAACAYCPYDALCGRKWETLS